jgi:hypothetical protein
MCIELAKDLGTSYYLIRVHRRVLQARLSREFSGLLFQLDNAMPQSLHGLCLSHVRFAETLVFTFQVLESGFQGSEMLFLAVTISALRSSILSSSTLLVVSADAGRSRGATRVLLTQANLPSSCWIQRTTLHHSRSLMRSKWVLSVPLRMCDTRKRCCSQDWNRSSLSFHQGICSASHQRGLQCNLQ